MNKFLKFIIIALLAVSCTEKKLEKKGFQVNEITEDENGRRVIGVKNESLNMETRPRNVLMTFSPEHRLTPIYKINYDKETNEPFAGSNEFHSSWDENYEKGNNWNNNIMPGFEAVYGYNFVNVSHYNTTTKTENKLFPKPVLIKTLYYPSYSKDTLNFQPINRNFYLVTVYDEDTNKDGFLNFKDLRRIYYFDMNGVNQKAAIPKNYSVLSSEYDSANDLMYIFAKKDKNKNGKMEASEPMDIFWIDLKNPQNTGLQYESE